MNPDPLDTDKTLVRGDKSAGYALAAGQMLGQYRILRQLGRGGMGEVYEVEHETLERRYALKLLPEEFAHQTGGLERFRREAKVMANLEHPNIIRVDEFGETGGRYWLRMELAKGEGSEFRGQGSGGEKKPVISLQDLAEAKGGRIPQEELVEILKQILDGLAYAHGHGAIHRDLKPSNILFSGGHVKIADFGLVRLVGEEWVRSQAQISVQRSMSMGDLKTLQKEGEGTSTRSMLGTYEYMSPEQKRGEEATERSDLYAVGLMAYRLLTGRGLSMKTPSQIDKSLAKVWDGFLAEALEEDAGERWGSAKTMQGGLEKIGEALGRMAADTRRAEESRGAQAEAERQARAQEEARRLAEQIRQREEAQRRAAAQAEAKRQTEQERQAAVKPPAKRKSSKGWVWALAVLAVAGGVIWAVNREPGSKPFASTPPPPRSQPSSPPAQRSNPAAAPAKPSAGISDLQSPFKNSLGMEFLPVAGLEGVLFSKWETRVQDFKAFVKETGYIATAGMYSWRNGSWGQNGDTWESPGFEQAANCPVVGVSWNDAQKFCEWLTKKERAAGKIGPYQRYRLPADWEWSVAVGLNESRGGTPESKDAKIDEIYPWNRGRGTWPPTGKAGNYCGQETRGDAGDMIDGYDDGYRRTSPVGTFDANANGLFDLGGNVWEWCEDWYNANQKWRVLRGASWGDGSPRFLLSSCRGGDVPVLRDVSCGFRVVLSR